VRYKFYAFRWDYSYAPQMHNKFMLIDGDELWTGSYNLSDNAEHNTFENMMQLRGLAYAGLITAYRDQFLTLWNTRRDDGSLADLQNEIATAANIPLVFDAIALDHAEVTALKQLIVDNCPAVYSDPYKDAPASHQYCPR
jgi:phosphatidylserine/phosphatidylglycerophosphate/cardiolipin synthase-like enzyme